MKSSFQMLIENLDEYIGRREENADLRCPILYDHKMVIFNCPLTRERV